MADTTTTPTSAPPVKTVTFTIDGRTATVAKGTTVLTAALQMGIQIPYFCWHPKLKPVGACRMCYVEIEKMAKLQVSCATEATDGMVVHTDSEMVKQGRKAVLEFTLANHPLDCPTCDKGGECDLQDLTFRHGYDDSRFDFAKRRHVEDEVASTFDDLRIGPEIILNRNRCILCYKCVRANKEAFGEYDLGAFERGNHTEINAAPGQQVDNPFSGNLVEICPVGALTNTDWRYKIRVWLTKTSNSVCPFTSSGTNLTLFKEDHKNRVFRVTSRRNDDIDDGWLADVTRYGYQMLQSPERLTQPLVKKSGKLIPATWDEALALIAKRLSEIQNTRGDVCIGGLISPALDNGSLHSFNKFMRTVVGSNAVDFRTDYRRLPAVPDSPFEILAAQPFSIAAIDTADVVLAIGSDLRTEHPNEYLRLRKLFNFGHADIFAANPHAVKSSDIATLELTYTPGTDEWFLAGLGMAAIEENLAEPSAAAAFKSACGNLSLSELSTRCGVASADMRTVARRLAEGKQVTILVGELVARSKERDTIAAALCNLVALLGISQRGQVAALAMHANSVGAGRLGLAPTISPALQKELATLWGTYPTSPEHSTDSMLAMARKEELNALLMFGVNPVMLYPDRAFALEALEKLDFVVVADLFETETTALADVVLPLAGWAEYVGEYVNLEGRVQTADRAIRPPALAKSAAEIIQALAERMGKRLFTSESARTGEINHLLGLNAALLWPSQFQNIAPASEESDPQYPHPLFVGDDPHHRGHWTEKAPSLVNFCSEAYVELSAATADRYGIKAGDPVKVESSTGKVILPARISEWLDTDTVFVPRNFAAAQVNQLLSRKRRTDRVKLSRMAD